MPSRQQRHELGESIGGMIRKSVWLYKIFAHLPNFDVVSPRVVGITEGILSSLCDGKAGCFFRFLVVPLLELWHNSALLIGLIVMNASPEEDPEERL